MSSEPARSGANLTTLETISPSIQRRSRAEELVAALRRRHAEVAQVTLDGFHERLRTDEVGIHVHRCRQPAAQLVAIEIAGRMRCRILFTRLLVADVVLQLRMLLRQICDF